MIIIRRQNGSIIRDPQKIIISKSYMAVASADMFSHELPNPITDRLPSARAMHLTLDWLYNQIFNHRNDRNIVIDIGNCPFLHVKE